DIQIKGVDDREDLSKKYVIDQVRLFWDSTVYIYTNGYKPQNHVEIAAKHLDDVWELERNITRDIAGVSLKPPIDSVLVYEVVVREVELPSEKGFEFKGLVFGT